MTSVTYPVLIFVCIGKNLTTADDPSHLTEWSNYPSTYPRFFTCTVVKLSVSCLVWLDDPCISMRRDPMQVNKKNAKFHWYILYDSFSEKTSMRSVSKRFVKNCTCKTYDILINRNSCICNLNGRSFNNRTYVKF